MTGIAINGRFMTRSPGAVDRFATELLRAWLARFGQSRAVRAIVPLHSQVRTRHSLGVRIDPAGVLGGHAWEQTELAKHCGDDLLLGLCNTGPISLRHQLVLLHTTGVFSHPWTYSFGFRNGYRCLLVRLVRRVGMVATVSAFAASELMEHIGGRAADIEVIEGAGEHMLSVVPDTQVLHRLQLSDRRYVLADDSQAWSRSFDAIIKAGSLLADLPVSIVAVGGTSNRLFANMNLQQSNIIIADGVSDGELRALYEHAECLVFPSLYEGFGLTALEAMSCGCPVVASRGSSLPEVCSDAALYCNPSDPADIADQVRRVFQSRQLRSELRQAGLAQARRYSWGRSAEQLERLLYLESCGGRGTCRASSRANARTSLERRESRWSTWHEGSGEAVADQTQRQAV
jgi:hypothetical protein